MENTQYDPITLSIFLPFYNEEKNIKPLVTAVIEAMDTIPRIAKYEVIMVNDGSADRTKEHAEELTKQYLQARLASHERNQGYGGAVKTGIASARYEYVFFMDGDLQFDIRDIEKLLVHVPEHQAVIGYRINRSDHMVRKINAELWNVLNRAAFGLQVKDIDCAFKLFKTDVVQNLSLISKGAMISSEILIRLQRQGIALKEVPVRHFPRQVGEPSGANFAVITKAFREFSNLYRQL